MAGSPSLAHIASRCVGVRGALGAEILEVKPEVVPSPTPVGLATAISPDVHEARA